MKRYTFETNAPNWYGTSSLISAFSAAGKMAVAVAQDRCFVVTQFTLKTGSVPLRLSACKSSLKSSWKNPPFIQSYCLRESVHACVRVSMRVRVCWIFVVSNTDNKDLTQHIYYMFREFVRQGVQRTHCQGYAGKSALVKPWNLILKHTELQTPARADKEQSSVRSSTHCHETYLFPRHWSVRKCAKLKTKGT